MVDITLITIFNFAQTPKHTCTILISPHKNNIDGTCFDVCESFCLSGDCFFGTVDGGDPRLATYNYKHKMSHHQYYTLVSVTSDADDNDASY